MAYIELDSKFLGSSLNNFIVFQNNNSNRPYVLFQITGNNGGTLEIRDALDDDGYRKTITYSSTDIISDSSFRIKNDVTATTFSLYECLKKNQIFFDLEVYSSGSLYLKAYIDSSTRYSITSSGSVAVGGTFVSYVPKEPNKFVILENISGDQINLEKYAFEKTVGFNVTAPFEHSTFKDPFRLRMMAYRIDDNELIEEGISNNDVTVLPTTLSKFQDINLSRFFSNGTGERVNFLTNRYERDYNYGEVVGLSVLTDRTNLTLKKTYYTVSGKYLGTNTGALYSENPWMRYDFYFDINVEGVESSTNKQVGYVMVSAYDGSVELTNPIRFNVVPKCNENNEIFFINEVGGIDSFNFLGERIYNASIDDQKTFFKNQTRRWGRTKEIEVVGQKKNNVEHVLKTTIINKVTAKWLNEMNKSKYAFLFTNGDITKFKKIIITDLDIDVSDRENTFEIEMTYQDSDANISI